MPGNKYSDMYRSQQLVFEYDKSSDRYSDVIAWISQRSYLASIVLGSQDSYFTLDHGIYIRHSIVYFLDAEDQLAFQLAFGDICV